MIEFRQKDFSKLGKASKELMESPVTKTALVVSGPALGVANLSLNMSRKKKDTELRKEQLEAMEDLTRALRDSNNMRVKEAAKQMKRSFRKKHPEDVQDADVIIIPNPISSFKRKIK